jgi:hypothetical protein
MSETPRHGAVQIQIEVEWPPDTYKNAMPTNIFVFNDMGDNLCLAFGFVPPPPGIEALLGEGPVRLVAERIQSVAIPKSMVVPLASKLQQLIDDNPALFPQVLEEDS